MPDGDLASQHRGLRRRVSALLKRQWITSCCNLKLFMSLFQLSTQLRETEEAEDGFHDEMASDGTFNTEVFGSDLAKTPHWRRWRGPGVNTSVCRPQQVGVGSDQCTATMPQTSSLVAAMTRYDLVCVLSLSLQTVHAGPCTDLDDDLRHFRATSRIASPWQLGPTLSTGAAD